MQYGGIFAESEKKSKKERVRDWLLAGRSITPQDAISMFRAYRLGAIIFNLRKEGMEIETEILNGENPHENEKFVYAKYTYRPSDRKVG